MPLTLPWTKRPLQEAKGTTSGVATPWSTPPVDEAAGALSDAPAGITTPSGKGATATGATWGSINTPWSKSPMGDLGASAGTMWSDLAAGKGKLASTSAGQSAQGAGGANATGFTLGDGDLSSTRAGLGATGAPPEKGVGGFLDPAATLLLAQQGAPGKAYRDDIVKKKATSDIVEGDNGVGAGFGDVGAGVGNAPGSAGDTLYDQADSFWGDISGQFPEQLADTERIAGRKEALAARRASEMGSSMGSGLSGGLAGGLAQAQLTGQQAIYDEQRQVKQRQIELQVTRLDQMIQEARDAKEFERAQQLQAQRDEMITNLAYAGALSSGPSGA